MNIFNKYLDKQRGQYSKLLDPQGRGSSLFVIIPCFNEPDILPTLNSLADCCAPDSKVSVLVVVNDSEDADEGEIAQNISTLKCIGNWQIQHQHLFFDVQRIYAHSLPQKWAGVGWARKIGMDEAVNQILKNEYSDGIIVSLDADTTVLSNYLQIIEEAFNKNPLAGFFTIHFEHIYDNKETDQVIREGIVRYELHMRYYRNALQWCGYPHAIHTVGSGFAVRGSAYVKQGGMNRRKAGEDFYFLHKLVPSGKYGNINSTTVFPSPRQSSRVPFGTGAAIKKWIEGSPELNCTYSLGAFGYLKPLFAHPSLFWNMQTSGIAEKLRDLHPSLQEFCKNSQAVEGILELRKNCSNIKVFAKRFFHLFNAFWILKYLNYVHQNTLSRPGLVTESALLLDHLGIKPDHNASPETLLEIFRNLDRMAGAGS
jgi:glycosyltransferase involved in cell wall biosynthesis